MNDFTQILSRIESGDPVASEQLLPLVYDELRKLAAAKLAQEKPGYTLVATALVHEAYLRLTDGDLSQHWNSRGHFFAAAAEAMRRILVERARRNGRIKHGGLLKRVELEEIACDAGLAPHELLAMNDALTRLEAVDAAAANLVKLRYFAGLTMPEVAAAMGVPLRTAERNWTFARTWLKKELSQDGQEGLNIFGK